MMARKTLLLLLSIFVLGLLVRFYAFRESLYFAYDQARDAYAALDIYRGHLKFIGPPVSGDVGLFHGVLFWYLIGPLYLLFQGNFELVAAVFRVINALGIFLVFGIGNLLFSTGIGLLAAFTFAISYEQSQYAIYVGNPSLAVIAVLVLMLGFAILLRTPRRHLALILIFSGAGTAAQFNLMYWYFFALVFLLLFLFRQQLKSVKTSGWFWALASGLLTISSFLISEIKHGFRSLFLSLDLLRHGFARMDTRQSKYLLYLNKYLLMFQDNFFGRSAGEFVVGLFLLLAALWTLKKSFTDKRFLLLFCWQFAWIFLLLLGGHTAYYTNAGLSTGLVISVFLFLNEINKRFLLIIPAALILSLVANLQAIKTQSPKSVSAEFVTTPYVKLADEIRLINQMYQTGAGAGFTVRQTGIPYLVQTTWAYLFHQYGEKVYGYLPYWETKMVEGFPGALPNPTLGTTCLRFRLVEPDRGLPQNLISRDLATENELSTAIKTQNFGAFILETRKAKDPNCHSLKPTSSSPR